MERWTKFVLRHRWPILVAWLAILLAGGFASTRLSALLSNTFTVPGTESERARTILERHYGDRSDGVFTVVYRVRDARDATLRARLQAATNRAADDVPTGRARALIPAGDHVLYGDIVSTLKLADAKGYSDDVYRALPRGDGVTPFVTGQAAIQHDLDPIFAKDLRKGESIALPIALAVLVAVFGISIAVSIPFLFAASTIMATLGAVYLFAHTMTMATYVTNLVQLIGLGIAIDYSLLVVYRFREELRRADDVEGAIVRTMQTAGRAVIFSGATVAIGLALLLFMPLPFMRSMGVGGFLIPIVSILAAATLQPALLSVYGRRGVKRYHPFRRVLDVVRRRLGRLAWMLPRQAERGLWARLAHAIMRRPVAFLAGGAALLVAAAIPVYALQLTPGSASGIPQFPQSVRGFNVLKDAVGPGALSPSQIVVDSGRPGGVRAPEVQAAIGRLAERIQADPETAAVRVAPRRPFVDRSGRYEQVVVAGRHEYGEEPAQRFVDRLRGELIPAAGFPSGTEVLAGGGPPQGVDFLDQAYRYFPWLVGAVLVLTYLLLMRAFRSVLLPLKAVVLNLLSVAASYGMLVVMFKWGLGSDLFGLYQFGQVEGWIPIFLFAMLFGLSMDYEVFLVTRMREEWDEGESNADAVAHGLERTGRIVTAAAVIMVAAFSGFVAGRIVGLQEFGLGLAVAILVDATLVRALLVPSLMALFGRYNWWLPRPLARVVRVPPSPLEQPGRAALRPAGR
ncbi:MAG TPA: MMPL family transporter [Gaiellaceae bacterium]|nr:MMPL family transporter [Gaiellaceae bacterium]